MQDDVWSNGIGHEFFSTILRGVFAAATSAWRRGSMSDVRAVHDLPLNGSERFAGDQLLRQACSPMGMPSRLVRD